MAQELNVGIIGAGMMGQQHATSIGAHGAAVAVVHDVQLDAAQKLADTCNGAMATDNLDAFFNDRDLDAVVIATPPPVRIDPVRLAAERGIHLMVEKPPALTMRDAAACQRLIDDAGIIAAVGFQLRYHPLYEILRDLLAGHSVHLARTVCTVYYYLTFEMSPWFLQSAISGGPIAEQAIHLLDCVRWLLGQPSAKSATGRGVKNMALDREEFDAENAMQIVYELDSGTIGVHTNHCGQERFAFDLEFIGPHLRLTANMTDSSVRGYIDDREIDIPAPDQSELGLDKTQAWLRAIETNDTSLVRSPYADAMRTLELVEAARIGCREQRWIDVEEVRS